MASISFLNLTPLEEDEAKKVLERARDVVALGEADRSKRILKAKKNHDFWMNRIWDDTDKAFFDSLDISPYEFPVQRALINNLISRQRSQPVSFDLVPTDIHSYDRHRRGRDIYVEQYGDRHGSPEEAGDFYDKYGDDQYAKAVTTLIHNTRIETKARHVESENFQEGVITGLDFLKAVYSRKHNKSGGIEITRRSQRAVFYDESSVEYDLSDIEFIGEVHLLYKSQLISQYPEHRDEIEEIFKYYTKLDKRHFTVKERNWESFFRFVPGTGSGDDQVPVAELWYLDTEQRYVVVNKEIEDRRLVKFGLSEEEIVDKLLTKELANLQELAQEGDPDAIGILQSPNVKQDVANIAREKYDIEITYEPIWYKVVFSYNALLEYKRSPLPHGTHPYFPFFAQYSEGEFTSLMDDIEDVIIAINKALAIRELMMAHGSKNLVVVDEEALAASGYDIEDLAEQWTSIGGVFALKVRGGKKIREVIDSITTVGDGLPAIQAVIQDLDARLYQISGVNMAQLGITERETTASAFRQQLIAGQSNNGIIFDNFTRSLEGFYSMKVVPLVVWLMKNKKQRVIRSISEEFKPWIELDYDDTFDLFEEAIYSGQYSLTLQMKEDNKQLAEQRASKYLEIAMANPAIMPLEVALEFSPDPDRYKIIQRIKEVQLEKFREQVASQVDIQLVQQTAMETGLSPEVVADLVKNLQKQRAKQLQQEEQSGLGAQIAQGAPELRESANAPMTEAGIEQTIQ